MLAELLKLLVPLIFKLNNNSVISVKFHIGVVADTPNGAYIVNCFIIHLGIRN